MSIGTHADPAITDPTLNATAIALLKGLLTLMGGTTGGVKYAVIDAASSGDNTLVAAVTGKKIRVLAVVLVASGTVTVRFESAASGTALTGQMQLTAQTGFSSGFSPVGHFETVAAQLLNLELSGAVSVDGWLVYVEV